MTNIFKSIAHFFTGLFGDHGATVQKILHDASSFVNLALPIVQEVEVELKALPQTPAVGEIAKFLERYIPEAEKAAQVATGFANLPANDLWHSIATAALSAIAPTGTAASLLNLAVELAYNVIKSKAAK